MVRATPIQIAALTAKDPCIEMTVVLQTAKSTLKWANEQLGLVVDFLQAAAGEEPPRPTPSPAPTRPTLPTQPTPSADSRLPTAVVPEDYVLKVVPYLSGDKQGTFEGEVTIKVNVAEQTDSLKLHAAGLTFSESNVTITDDSQAEVTVNDIWTNNVYEWKEISLEKALEAGKTYNINVKYTASFSSDLKGFFVSTDDGRYAPSEDEQFGELS